MYTLLDIALEQTVLVRLQVLLKAVAKIVFNVWYICNSSMYSLCINVTKVLEIFIDKKDN